MIKAIRHRIYTMLCVVILGVPAIGQSEIKSIQITDGLSQGMIFDIVQDQEDYIWFATFNGLNRYNGYDIEVIGHEPFAEHQLHSSETIAMEEGPNGLLWIGTNNSGLYVRDPKTTRIYPVKWEATAPQNPQVNEIKADGEGNIWFTTGQQVYRIPHDVSNTYPVVPERLVAQLVYNEPTAPFAQVVPVIDEYAHFHLFISGQALLRYAPEQDTFIRVRSFGSDVQRVGFMDQSRLWVTTHRTLTVYGPDDSTQFHFPSSLSGQRPRLHFDQELNVAWITHEFSPALYCINFSKDIPTLEKCLTLQPHEYPTSILVANHKLWIGTNGYGVRYLDFDELVFEHIAPSQTIKWIGTLDSNTLLYAGYEHMKVSRATAHHQRIIDKLARQYPLRSIQRARNRQGYWVLTGHPINQKDDQKGVLLLDAQGNLLRRWYNTDIDVHYGAAIQDSQGNLWLGGGPNTFIQFRADQSQPVVHNPQATQAPPPDNYKYARHLHLDAQGNLWKATPNGLEVFHIPTQSHHTYHYNPQDSNSLSSNSITVIIDDPKHPDQYLWVGTAGGGLNHLNKTTGQATHYSLQDGFPDNVIYGLIHHDGLLWMSSNRGIFAFSPDQNSLLHYTSTDGLQHDEFNTGAHHYSPHTGKLYFGGINGITAFDPTALRRIQFVPTLHLEALMLNHHKVHPQNASATLQNTDSSPLHINYQNELTLNWKQNQIAISYAAISFNRSIQYRYKLTPFSSKWVYAGASRQAIFNNLRPGRYTFTVESTNIHGEWCGNTRQLQIHITPPWWASKWAYTAYIIALGILLTLSIQYYRQRIIQRHDAQHKNLLIQRLKTLDQLKENFFHNVTHELRTPLQLIIAPLKQAIDHQAPWERSTQLAYQSALQLQQHVDELIQLAKLNNGHIQIHPQTLPIHTFFQDLINRFQPMQNLFHVTLQSQIAIPPDTQATFDPMLWSKILSNILSNAIKFSHKNGTVHFNATQEDNCIHITVIDHGIGIKPQQIQNLFNRFYRTDAAQQHDPKGAGIGLHYTRELIQALNGNIHIQSEWQKGTTVHISLPIAPAPTTTHVPTQPAANLVITDNPDNKPQILLAEDTPEVRNYLAQVLQEAGYHVLEAHNGQQALDITQQQLPDLILTDAVMPNMDGWQLTNALKSSFLTSHIPVVMLTARNSTESNLSALKHGADVYLTKPIQAEILLQQLNNLRITRQRYQQHLQQLLRTENNTPTPPLLSKDEAFIEQIRRLIIDNLPNENFGVDSLAQTLNISRSLLYRKIQALTDMSPSAMIRDIKMGHAQHLLRTGQHSVTEVAYLVGFNNPKYFATVYKQVFGHPPSDTIASISAT